MSDLALDEIDRLKRALRGSCTVKRDALSLEQREAAARALAETGIDFAVPPAEAVVSAYSAMGSELAPRPLVERLAVDGFRTCLPVVTPLGRPLVFRAWKPGDPLVSRKWGILEPADEAPEVDPDVLLVPLLAFDVRGVRLGYGGGYYDRTLQRLRGIKPVIAIGLAYSQQELDTVPRGPHDQLLDWVLTEHGPIRPR